MAKGSDLLLEYRQEGRKTWAIRFYQDGLVKEYSDSEMVFENDKIVTRDLPLAWRELTRLSPSEMKNLLGILHKADFFSLPEKVGDSRLPKDGTQFVWKVHLSGKTKTVLAYAPEASENPALKILGEMIQDVTADAFDRESGEEESDG